MRRGTRLTGAIVALTLSCTVAPERAFGEDDAQAVARRFVANQYAMTPVVGEFTVTGMSRWAFDRDREALDTLDGSTGVYSRFYIGPEGVVAGPSLKSDNVDKVRTVPVARPGSFFFLNGRDDRWETVLAGWGDVTDGTSSTLLLGERPPSTDYQYGWWYAGIGQNLNGSVDMVLGVAEINRTRNYPTTPRCPTGPYGYAPGNPDSLCSTYHYWSLHPGGAHFAFADGSVRWLGYEAAPVVPALATRSGAKWLQRRNHLLACCNRSAAIDAFRDGQPCGSGWYPRPLRTGSKTIRRGLQPAINIRFRSRANLHTRSVR